MSISLGDPDPAECKKLLQGRANMALTYLSCGAVMEIGDDAVKVCCSTRSPSHVCGQVFDLIEKWIER